jgi:hypothetical protein
MRQGTDPIRDVLQRLKVGHSTLEDEEYLNTHCGPSSAGWEEAVHDPLCKHIFSHNADVSEYNFDMCRRVQYEQGIPAIRCHFANGNEAPVGGVPDSLWFQLEGPCQVGRNGHVAGGIVNGLPGWWADIGWDDGEPENPENPPVPDIVLIKVRSFANAFGSNIDLHCAPSDYSLPVCE